MTLLDIPTSAGLEAPKQHDILVTHPKLSSLAVGSALHANPDTDTSLAPRAEFNPESDTEGLEVYVQNKAERYAIAAVFADRAADDLVSAPINPRESRFKDLPDVEAIYQREEAFPSGKNTVAYGTGTARDILKTSIHYAVEELSESFLDMHPELSRAADRFSAISDGADLVGSDIDDHHAIIENISETMNFFVLDEFVPFVQRMIDENKHIAELHTPDARNEFAKDLAKQLLFDVAAINLGHLGAIQDSETSWGNFMLARDVEASPIKGKNGEWRIQFAEGHQRPPKPKDGLAGPTLGCPALMQLEAGDPASPLHRIVYATINEAHARGLFSDTEVKNGADVINEQRTKYSVDQSDYSHADITIPRD